MTSKQNDFSAERQARAGLAVMRLDAVLLGWRQSDYEVTGLSIRAPRGEGDEYLVTIRALGSDGGPVVAFHSSYNLMELLIGLENRLSNGDLRWKPDMWGR